jgi:site-specific recombinase XerD
MMLGEFCEWLRTRTNQQHRPYQEETISAYREAGAALSAWMTKTRLEVDFTGIDTKALNRFFRWYYDNHGQGETNTEQRNLRHLFTWLEAEYDNPHPYTDGLNRYAHAKTRPSTLSQEFIVDLLEITGGGRGRGSRTLVITP